jgi:hypothetical protein
MPDEQYKFPHELDTDDSVDNEIEVEVVDDTPEEDRGRVPLPKQIVDELDNDDLEEYSDKVKKRLSQMKKVWHDERREKERAAREREEALRFAQQAYEENKTLRQRLGAGEQVFLNEVAKAASLELISAKEKLRNAYESGDADLITDAQEALTDAKLRIKEVERFQPSLQAEESSVQNTYQVQAPPTQVVDHKAEAWRQENTWFGVDEEMTALALGLHEKLVRSGVDPRSDDYYRRVNETVRRRFPERFEDADPVRETRMTRSAPRKAATVVAPVSRGTAPRQVRLTPSQVAIAKRLGLTNEAYARELLKLEVDNG